MLSSFDTAATSSILGIRAGRLRYWRRIGLVIPSCQRKGRNYYDFQDLVCLRTAQALVNHGLQATKVRDSIDSLRGKRSRSDNRWADRRIYAWGRRAVISHQDHLVDAQTGQLLFKFDGKTLTRVVEAPRASADKSAEDWFLEGLRQDTRPETYTQALEAYKKAVRLDPTFADAYVNMGNIYYEQSQYCSAEDCYRRAIATDPENIQAYFNLANTLDEIDSTREAIECFQKALKLDPEFSDAYYNLAVVCEKLGAWDKAYEYWNRYLELESAGAHAETVRRRIELLLPLLDSQQS